MRRAVWVLASVLVAGPALAGKGKDVRKGLQRGPSANAGEIPALAELLHRTGWEPTPELSGAFQAGYVFQATEMGHRLQLEDCFEVEPTVSTYTSAEVVTQLQAGVSVHAGMAAASASGSLVKKVKFSTPEHIALPALKMVPTDSCRATLEGAAQAGIALDTMYVVQEVLTAQIAEQTCGRIDASGSFVGLGAAETELAMACAQESLEPVAIAYRTTPVNALIGEVEVVDPAPERERKERVREETSRRHEAAAPEPPPPAPKRPSRKDSDDDGISDMEDLCPDQPEDLDDYEDEDGCPEADNDQDGVPDTDDRCPSDTEDRDGFEDDDGCPDPDNDGDGIVDARDACPSEPESVNGVDDEDGCPDKAIDLAKTRQQLRQIPKFSFETGRGRLRSESLAVVERVATILREADFPQVEVQGHTDNVGDDQANLRLSQARADAILAALVEWGVPANRLSAMGYGETLPVADNKTSEGRAANRRIEFMLLDD